MSSRSTLFAATVLLAACASTPPPKPAAPAETTSATAQAVTAEPEAAEPAAVCDVVCGQAKVVLEAKETADAYTEEATARANQLLASMHDDLLRCYKGALATNPNAHGFLTVEIVIETDGRVRSVDTTGGAVLGERAMSCIVSRIQEATFAPVHNGGTQRIQVPLTFRKVGADEPI